MLKLIREISQFSLTSNTYLAKIIFINENEKYIFSLVNHSLYYVVF